MMLLRGPGQVKRGRGRDRGSTLRVRTIGAGLSHAYVTGDCACSVETVGGQVGRVV